jgi:hypothetical protein
MITPKITPKNHHYHNCTQHRGENFKAHVKGVMGGGNCVHSERGMVRERRQPVSWRGHILRELDLR